MMKKRILSLFLCVMMVVSMAVVPAQAAYTPKHTEEAETLYNLGLFRGTGTNPDGTPIFSLQNKATRLQALIILIRLLGLEEEALATTAPNPFSDIANGGTGAKYAAYAYSVGLTNGIGGGKFGNTDVTPAQFTTFVLRALGYDDKAGDFKVSTAIAKGREIGLIESDMLTSGSSTLLRDECVKINYNALKTNMKGTTKTLSTKLIDDGVLTKEAVQNAGLYSTTVYIPCDPTKRTFKLSDVKAAIPNAAYVGGAGSSSTNDAAKKLAEMDITPRNLLLNMSRVSLYVTGITNNLPARTNVSDPSFYSGVETYDLITVIDKDYHLVGYSVVAPSAKAPDKLAFTVLDYDGAEAIEEAKKSIDNIYKSAKEFDKTAISREDITVVKETKKNTTSYLRVDTAKLPEAVKNAKYYYVYRYGDGVGYDSSMANGKEDMVKYGIHKALFSMESTSPSCKVLTEIGTPHFGNLLNDNSAVLLLDANKQVLGYTIIKKGEAPVTETMMDENGKVLTSNDTRDYFAIQNEALKKNGTAALADAACFALDNLKWIDSPKSDADYINNVLYSFMVGNYSLNFAFPSAKEFTQFESAVLLNWKNLCSGHAELMGVYSNAMIQWKVSVNNKGNYLCQMVVDNPGLTEAQVYAQQLEAVKAVKALYNQMHSSGKITTGMTQKQIAQVYYDYFKSQNIKDSGLAWNTTNRGEVMKYDSLYACMVAKKADCLGRTGAFNMMMHMEGIYAKGLYCHPIGEPEGSNHTLSYVMLDGAEYISDWGNNMSTRSIDEARAKYEFFDDSLAYARNSR